MKKAPILLVVAVSLCVCAQAVIIADGEIKEKPLIYTVQPGDSIEKIAGMHTVLPWRLRQANNLVIGSIIHPGQVLAIPKPKWRPYEGKASWYGPGFNGKKMANGERYDQNEILVAHRHYPFGLELEITNLKNGKKIIAQVKDRGPYVATHERQIDLSYGAAKALGALKDGVIPVFIRPL